MTTNSLQQIVPGSKVIYNGTIYDVGEIINDSANLYLSGCYICTVDIKNTKPI